MKILGLLVVLFFTSFVQAQMESSSQEAFQQTAEVLKDPSQRNKAFAENPKYKEGEKGADMLVRGNEAQKQQLYEMAAEVLQKLAEKANGDPVKMQAITAEAQKNPEKFMNEYFSEAQKKQVRDLANQIQKDRQPKSPSPAR